jgi:Transcriptional activator of glycolytic enzymes
MANNINRLRAAAPFAALVVEPVAQGNANPVIAIPAGQPDAVAPPTPPRVATLSPASKLIHELWTEWTHGIGGRKPASQFTTKDKMAAGRFLFSRRNEVWRLIRRMVDAGIDADVACDCFYQAYGHTKGASAIIQCIYDDRRQGRGIHPNLSV